MIDLGTKGSLLLQGFAGASALLAQAAPGVDSWVGFGATGLCIITLMALLKASEDRCEKIRAEASADRREFVSSVNAQTQAVTMLTERLDVVDQVKELLDGRMRASQSSRRSV